MGGEVRPIRRHLPARGSSRVEDFHTTWLCGLADSASLGSYGYLGGLRIARRSGLEERGDQDGESVSRRQDDRRDDCRAQEFYLL